MRKKIVLISLAGLLVFSLAACGKEGEDTKGEKGTSAKETAANVEGDTIISQEDLDAADEALELLESMKPEGWDENNCGMYIYDVWDEEFLPDCVPGPVEGIKVSETSFKDYKHETMNQSSNIGPIYYDSVNDYREYGVHFYATEAQLDEYLKKVEEKGFTGGQRGSREDEWWEFYYYNEDGWFMYIVFNTRDDEDGAYDGHAGVYVTDDVFEKPESIDGIPLPQKGMPSSDFTKNYYIAVYDDSGYNEKDFNIAADTLPETNYTAWVDYYGVKKEDAKAYAQQLVGEGWELSHETDNEEENTYYAEMKKDNMYGLVRFLGYDQQIQVGFSDMIENLSY